MIRQLSISKKQWQEMLDHVAQHDPLEACGLLVGKNNWVEEVIFVRNQAQSPERFVMNPYEQLKALDRIESSGLDLIGIFHSHPTGPEIASAPDIAEAAYEAVYLIWSLNEENWKLRGFWIENRRADEVSILIREE